MREGFHGRFGPLIGLVGGLVLGLVDRRHGRRLVEHIGVEVGVERVALVGQEAEKLGRRKCRHGGCGLLSAGRGGAIFEWH